MQGMFSLATFLTPESIGTVPGSVLFVLPLTIAISVVYKATKVHSIKPKAFVKECAVLFGSIVVFLGVAALILCLVAWFMNEKIPALLQ